MIISQEKIDAKLSELNEAAADGLNTWVRADGLFALTETGFSKNGDSEFFPGNGIQTVVFYNTSTGELKTYYARDFLEDQNGPIN